MEYLNNKIVLETYKNLIQNFESFLFAVFMDSNINNFEDFQILLKKVTDDEFEKYLILFYEFLLVTIIPQNNMLKKVILMGALNQKLKVL